MFGITRIEQMFVCVKWKFREGGEKVQEEIEKLISVVLEDVSEIRKSQMEVEDRLPVEIMALNAVANAQKVIWEGTHQHLS